jgi:hypothetical protein
VTPSALSGFPPVESLERTDAGCATVEGMAVTAWGDLLRPVLRDGLRVVRRDDRHLQIGLDPPHRLVLDDLPGLHSALTRLDRTPPAAVRHVVDRLVEDGWVVDAADDGGRRTTPAPVAIEADPTVADHVARACATVGLVRAEHAPLRLVVTLDEPRRALCDALVRDDVTHLWVAVMPTAARLGPFVDPGRSACLRCVDAHLGDLDPRRATVLHQLEELPAPPTTAPDPCLVQLAVAWAVRDVVRVLDGHPSSLRSATVTVTEDLQVTRHDWLRHPHCGCAWG